MKKLLAILENHVEKIVIVLVGLLSLWLLWSNVIHTPNTVRLNNKNVLPSNVDTLIRKDAQELNDILNTQPKPKEKYQPQVKPFLKEFRKPLHDLKTNLAIPVPPELSRTIWDNRKYRIPKNIPSVQNVNIAHIRCAAYVPTTTVDMEQPYTETISEPNDIDLITVEAEFDAKELARLFEEAFNGENVREQWRDPCLAQPVFAAVDLQRQEKLQNGLWSPWKSVPRLQIESLREFLEVSEHADDLPRGGILVKLLQFRQNDIQQTILQPHAYVLASHEEEWFPPSLYDDYVEIRDKLQQIELSKHREQLRAELEQRRNEALESRRDAARERSSTRMSSRTRPASTSSSSIPPTGGSSSSSISIPPSGGSSSGTTITRNPNNIRRPRERRDDDSTKKRDQQDETTKLEKSLNELYDQLDERSLEPPLNWAEMTDPVHIWSMDDTAQPNRKYRYRIRIGVFNPVAGTEQTYDDQSAMRNQVILWSETSPPTETITVPPQIYFFAQDVQPETKRVSLQVSKFVLGYWYSKDFFVAPGENIGQTAEPKGIDNEEETSENNNIPETVDFYTGATLLDVFEDVNRWDGPRILSDKPYYDMLYTYEGDTINKSPIKMTNWTTETKNIFTYIKREEKNKRHPFKPWRDTGESPTLKEVDMPYSIPPSGSSGSSGGTMMPPP